MASVFMVSNKNKVLSLDSTEKVSKSRNNTLTKSSVMNGTQVSDGFTVGNPSITFNGICSYSKIMKKSEGNDAPTPAELDLILDEMVLSQERFMLYGNELIPSMKDVVIISHNVVQAVYENAVEVTLTVEQAFVSNSAQKSRVTKPSVKTKGDVTEEQDLGQGNKTQQKEEVKESLLTSRIRKLTGG